MKEADVIRVIKDYLQIQRNQKKLMYIRNNSGAMPIEGKKSKKQYFMGVPITDGESKRRYIRFGDKGSPDFFVFVTLWLTHSIKTLEVIAIEVKSDTGKQSKDQKKWQKDFEAIGGVYYIVRNLDELIKIIG